MNLLLVDAAEVVDGAVRLPATDRRALHLRDVLRVTPGRTLRAGLIDGPLGEATVTAVDAGEVVLALTATTPAPAPLPIALWLALPRPKVLARVLQAAASMGLASIELTNAWRVDKSYLKSPRLTSAALRDELRLGAEQGGTSRLPAVRLHDRFMGLVAQGRGDAVHALVAHPHGAAPLEQVVRPGPLAPTVLAIGPEGGWIDRELATLAEVGFAAVSLGAPILRTEAAVVALVSQLLLLGRLDR